MFGLNLFAVVLINLIDTLVDGFMYLILDVYKIGKENVVLIGLSEGLSQIS